MTKNMNLRTLRTLRTLLWPAAAGLLLLALACSSPQPAAVSSLGAATPTPNVPATAAAQSAPAGAATAATPTPVPAQVSQTALDFATGHLAISQRWDQFHKELDSWRQGLASCDPSSVQVALGGFAGDSAGITQAARGLPRTSSVRQLSDQLIRAAEREEEALRLLRDSWQPGPQAVAPTPSSNGNGASGQSSPVGFEGVSQARSAASLLRQQVADDLTDLQEKTGTSSQSQVLEFATDFQNLSSAWNRFHQDYDAFRASEGALSSTDTVDRLGALVSQFRGIVLAARDLPADPATNPISVLVAEAVQAEDLALRRLRGTFQKSGEQASGEADGPTPEPAMEQGSESANGETNGATPTFVAADRSLFDLFDGQLVEANRLLRQAAQELAAVQEEVSQESRAAVTGFSNQYDALLRQWDAFHQDYDSWRRTEGGCDRAAAVAALGGFTLQFRDLAVSVGDLPRATFLRTLGELMVEAAQGEEQALRDLRNTWRPFDPQVFQTLDHSRNNAAKLRRQVDLGLQELLERFGVSPPQPGA